MKASARMLMIASSILLSAPALGQELAEGSVRAFIARMDAALEKRDIDTIRSHMAEHAVVSGTASTGTQFRVFRMNKSQYLQGLANAWSTASGYTYRRTNERILIDGGRATVTADVSQSVVMDGRTVTSTAKELATVENVDGTLMLTQVVANTTRL